MSSAWRVAENWDYIGLKVVSYVATRDFPMPLFLSFDWAKERLSSEWDTISPSQT